MSVDPRLPPSPIETTDPRSEPEFPPWAARARQHATSCTWRFGRNSFASVTAGVRRLHVQV